MYVSRGGWRRLPADYCNLSLYPYMGFFYCARLLLVTECWWHQNHTSFSMIYCEWNESLRTVTVAIEMAAGAISTTTENNNKWSKWKPFWFSYDKMVETEFHKYYQMCIFWQMCNCFSYFSISSLLSHFLHHCVVYM